MKTKKIFAALAACAMAVAVTGVTSFAATLDEEPEEVVDEETDEEIIDEDTDDTDDFTDEDFDEDFTDEDFGDDFYDDEDFDEDYTDDTAADDQTPTDTVDNTADEKEESPKTGNAPVALAVIPVALAAAAVVAKKSK